MASKTIFVRLGASATPVGELIFDKMGNKETSAFTYSDSWLQHPKRFALSPDMPLQASPFYRSNAAKNSSALPLPIGDGTPDSWGKAIIRAYLGGRVDSDLDYLLQADDELRSGALRYYLEPDGEALATKENRKQVTIPRLLDLDQIILASRKFEEDPVHYRESRGKLLGGDILKDAVGSLGGARPKVNAVDENGDLWIVKLAKKDDEWAVARAEVMALKLAGEVGLKVSEARLVSSGQTFPICIVKRFDRISHQNRNQSPARVPFISAQTFMGLEGAEPGSYENLALKMRTECVDPTSNMQELFRRVMFNILISSTDDHLRNQGFLMTSASKWELSPAFDINPDPDGGTLKTAISEIHGNAPCIKPLIDAAPFFELTEADAKQMAKDMAGTISTRWRPLAAELGMSGKDVKLIAPALDNEQIKVALKM